MKLYPRLLLRCPFEIVKVGDEVTAVSVGGTEDNYNGVVLLKNESTRFLFEQLQKAVALPELVRACMEKYPDSPVDEVGPQVLTFLNKLREQGLLVADPTHGIKVED